MPTLGYIVESSTTPSASRYTDTVLLGRAVARGYGTLRISVLAGTVLALGRYHLAPAQASDVTLHRRLTGGRAAVSGDGFVQVSLTLPHRSALVSDEPLALAPEQILNRAVRGLLGGLDAAGVSSVYPGRDTITVARRTIAVLGLEIDARGATLVEASIALEHDQSMLPHLLERVDVDGVIGAAMVGPDDATSLVRELRRRPSIEEVATSIRRGYESRLGIGFVEEAALPSTPEVDDGFVHSRAPRPDLDRHGSLPTMLGLVESHARLAADGTLDEVMLAGDLLAPSGTIDRLESALRGCAAVRARLEAVIADVVRPPNDFILGVGPLGAIAEVIARGVG